MTSELVQNFVMEFSQKNKPGTMLPSDSALANLFQCSRITVQRTMARLARQNILNRIQGKGTFLPGKPVLKAKQINNTDSVQQLVNHITAAIGKGEYVRGNVLPSYKEMCSTFHVSATTVRAAYKALEEKRFVVRVGQYYQVGRFVSLLRGKSIQGKFIALLAPDINSLQFLFTEHQLSQSFHKLEHELNFHGISLEYVVFSDLPHVIDAWIRRIRYPAGIILTGSSDGTLIEDEWNSIKPHIQRLRKSAGTFSPKILQFALWYRIPDTTISAISATHAVTAYKRQTALFLFKKQARNVTIYLDIDTTTGYSFVNDLRIIPELEHLDRQISTSIYVRAKSRDHFLKKCLRQCEPSIFTSRLSKYREFSFEELEQKITAVDSLEDMCRKAPIKPALLFNFDSQAAQAIAWCNSHRKKIPEDFSIISFENSGAYQHLGITSCTMDWETTGYLMAHSLISAIPLQKTSRGFIELPSVLYERKTTS